jgi:type I restriction enzyme S subunit
MVPSGWERKTLNKVAEIRTGVAKGKKGLKDPIEVSYLRVANVQDGKIDLSEVKSIQIERHQLDRYSLKKGDVLMTEGGDFDKLGRGDVWQGQIEPCLNQNHVFAVRVDPNKLLPYFLTTLSSSYYGKTYFLSCAKRTTNLASINSSQLKDFPVLLPPLPEQRQIAQILSTWDKAIVTTEKLIAASQQQKKALMQQLLTGKKRFAGFSEEWKEVKLKQLGEVVSGGTPSTTNSDYWDGDVFWVTPTDITKLKSHYIGSSIRKISKPGLLSCSAKLVPKGSLLVCSRATIGTLAITKTEMCTNQGFKNLVPNKSTDVEFLYYLLAHERHQLISKASGSTFLELSKKDFDNIRLKVPSFKEQQKIAAVLTSADQEIYALQSKLAHFKQEKKALMQQLLTGKRRVVLEAETSH